jgi:hypothetical protein
LDKETKSGIENLEKTINAEDLTKENQEETTNETIQSEELRYDNADRNYE